MDRALVDLSYQWSYQLEREREVMKFLLCFLILLLAILVKSGCCISEDDCMVSYYCGTTKPIRTVTIDAINGNDSSECMNGTQPSLRANRLSLEKLVAGLSLIYSNDECLTMESMM